MSSDVKLCQNMSKQSIFRSHHHYHVQNKHLLIHLALALFSSGLTIRKAKKKTSLLQNCKNLNFYRCSIFVYSSRQIILYKTQDIPYRVPSESVVISSVKTSKSCERRCWLTLGHREGTGWMNTTLLYIENRIDEKSRFKGLVTCDSLPRARILVSPLVFHLGELFPLVP